MSLNKMKVRDSLIFLGAILGWSSVLSYFFTSSDSYFGRNYHFFWPYVYIISLSLVVMIYFAFNKNFGIKKGPLSNFFLYLFGFLSIYGVALGTLMTFAIANLPDPSQGFPFYGAHYFLSSVIFYVAFFNLNKELAGLGSKIIYWFMIFIGLFVVISYLTFS